MGDSDRVRVPTNGHRPGLPDESAPGGPSTPAPDPTAEPDLRIAFTPGQLAAGFGILAGLILLIVGTRRRGQRSRDDERG